MQSDVIMLCASDLLNEWILGYEKLCIGTKRGINGQRHIIWLTKGKTVQEPHTPLTYALVEELTKFVDIAWIGGPNLQRLASVTLNKDGMLEIEPYFGEKDLAHHYISFTNNYPNGPIP